MITSYSVAVYPDALNFDLERIQSYILMAKRYGCTEIFSSAHLPELSFDKQLHCLNKLAQIVKHEQMELTVDFGGKSLYDILDNQQYKDMVSSMNIDFIRLDYGYETELMKRIVHELGIHGFVWNASIMSEQEVVEHNECCKEFEHVKIRACHNFYPRPETGLSEEFLKKQYTYFQAYQIPVTTCLAYLPCARGPLKEGLPTLEKHRTMPMNQAVIDLLQMQATNSILIGDEFISEEEFKILHQIIQRTPMQIRVHFSEDISDQEEKIILGQLHHIRYDSNDLVLRSQSSRQMAEFADCIKPNHTVIRNAYSLTIDNEKYQRYSGELQIVLQPLLKDERVNVVGYIDEQDTWKLDAYKEGFDFQFIKI